jgi:hypothetical protein
MSFLNKKIINIGLMVGVILLPLIFYYQKSSAAVDVGNIAPGTSAGSDAAISNSISFFLTTGDTIPNAPISISATSYNFDLDGSFIVWKVDGKTFKQGTGEKKIEVMLGDAGSKTKVTIDASLLSGQTYHKEITIIPATVDLLWQAYTYTPAWYKGKPLPSSTSPVKIVAVPYFKKDGDALIPASDLIYSWKLNYKNLQSQSGYGKKALSIMMPQLGYESRVELEVSTKDKTIIRKGVVKLSAGETETLLYKNHPTKGVEYSSALYKTIIMEEDTLGLKVEPFFFALRDLGSIVYNWSTNNKKIEGTEKLNNITFTKTADQRGMSTVSVETKNVRDFLQTAKADFLIDFNE